MNMCLIAGSLSLRGFFQWESFPLLRKCSACAIAVLAMSFVGCNPPDSNAGGDSTSVGDQSGVAAHAHPSAGPHAGELIELGDEAYHAEVLHDEDAGRITIYVLDSTGKVQVPIDASEVTINTVHGGKPSQFKLAALPDVDDPEGKASRFVSEDKDLVHQLDEKGTDPKLVVTIDGKSYRGEIAHGDGHVHGQNEPHVTDE